ncbi:hypothetical protein NUU61_001250 [Penicillium alfredii]|uniref:MYND-type domain-containing protein n=1 Tax=Penicillium alfredii TaxID=1506179 RepID=A0A9W9GB92_9EURO|nr:uncharacterized protein NUU61_001250 [Penicillium alfredii]KAJ5115491.1 hypothetical protein NUU61_001250 [Penicillium alfredii]
MGECSRVCSACSAPKAHYCSLSCQRNDWNTHKANCAGAQKYNCFLIRAPPTSATEINDSDYVEPFTLEAHGNWSAEMRELKQRMGWPTTDEAGKFYPHQPVDHWYYYVYHSEGANDPKSSIASR